jgi:two-component system cell cycle sensor histidine kinase/response regulator CckA
MGPELSAHGMSGLLGLVGIAVGVIAGLLIGRRRRRKPAVDLKHTLAALYDTTATAAVVTDREGKTVYCNGAGREWLGDQTPSGFLASHVAADFDREQSADRLIQASAAGLAAHADVPLTAPGAHGTGEPDWFRVSVRPLNIGESYILWNAEDVTANRTISDILTQERQDLADFMFFLPTAIYSVDVDGRFAFINQRFAEWLGYGVEELGDKRFNEVLSGQVRPPLDGEWRGEVQFKTRNGEIIPAVVLQSTYDDAGITRTRSVVIRDVFYGAIEAASKRGTYERFRGLFDSAPVAIAITDGDGLIADCNQAFEKLVSQTRAGLVGIPLADRLVDTDRRMFSTEVDKVLAGDNQGLHLDVSVMTDAGRDGTAQTSVFVGPLSAEGASGPAEGVVAHFIDVTDQKNLEAQFAQAQKMQAMGQLAGGVAHDFNNLLTAMIGFCDLLLQRHAAGDPSFADIMQIKQNANRAANLVRQLLAFSRKQPLQPKELNVTDELTELSHLLTRLIGESIEFKLVHGRELGLIKVDPGQFDQMIINLAVNARDAMPGGGTLTIATGVETFDQPKQISAAEQVPPGRYVRISVADTGKGIPPENLGRIFEPFFSTKKEIPGAGTGLGLATVYGIVRQTGGFILVDSAPGQGANFTIYLPRFTPEPEDVEARAAKAAADAAKPVEEAPPPVEFTRAANVLLVEDEDAVRVFAARALKSKGYKVLEARTGEQALDILNDQPAIDLMITDMMMPGMDGGTLARLIRVERPEIKILLISGYSEEVARGDIGGTEDFHFLPKPFSLSQLASKVKDVLQVPE